jgi:hypothetical protein
VNINLFINCLECWRCEPYERPNMQQIVSILKSMISKQSSNNSIHKIKISLSDTSQTIGKYFYHY